MAQKLKNNEWLVCVGSTALRAPDGTPMPSVPMYVIVGENEVDPKTRMAKSENGLSEDIAEVLAPKFKEYMEKVYREADTDEQIHNSKRV